MYVKCRSFTLQDGMRAEQITEISLAQIPFPYLQKREISSRKLLDGFVGNKEFDVEWHHKVKILIVSSKRRLVESTECMIGRFGFRRFNVGPLAQDWTDFVSSTWNQTTKFFPLNDTGTKLLRGVLNLSNCGRLKNLFFFKYKENRGRIVQPVCHRTLCGVWYSSAAFHLTAEKSAPGYTGASLILSIWCIVGITGSLGGAMQHTSAGSMM